MTVCVQNATLLSLTMYRSDLQYKLLCITNRRQIIAYQTAELADLDAESSEMEQLNNIDQVYELEQTNLETQLEAVNAEYDSVQKMLENNIKRDFKINAT